MIFVGAAASAYDDDEVYVSITAEAGETIKIGDTIAIPMNDYTFEEREITGMYRYWKKRKILKQITEGEWAECIVHNIHAGRIHTISSPYDDEVLEGDWVCGSRENTNQNLMGERQ